MNEYLVNMKFSEVFKCISEIRNDLNFVMNNIKPEEELWDNSDLTRRWKISERTLASWRHTGLISYVQVNGKIWYPKEARDSFLRDHLVKVQLNKEVHNHEN